jgi:hypothetical protein
MAARVCTSQGAGIVSWLVFARSSFSLFDEFCFVCLFYSFSRILFLFNCELSELSLFKLDLFL